MHNWVIEAQILSQHEALCSATTKNTWELWCNATNLCPVFTQRPFQSVGDDESCVRNQSSASALECKNPAPSMWSVQNKPREMQGSTEVWILSASHRQMFWLGFNRHIHYLCSDAGRAEAAQQTCALQCPGTPVCLSLQTPPWPAFLHGLAGAILCSPTWAPEVFLLVNVE